MLTFVHTADLHLGQPLHRIAAASPDAAARVRQARLDAIDTVGRLATKHDAAFVLIAGDLFDHGGVDAGVVAKACQKLAGVPVPVLVLPGNHDLSGLPGGVFARPEWTREEPPNVAVLGRREPHFLPEAGAVVLPAPADPASPADPTAHLTEAFGAERADAFRIGLAHGGTTDFAELSGGRSATIRPGRAAAARLDYLALGDWHGFQRVDERTAYAGSPEPTSFVQNASGHAVVVRIPAPGDPPVVEAVEAAATRWVRHAVRLRGAEEVASLDGWLRDLEAPAATLLRLELDAVLTAADAAGLDATLEAAGHRLLHLRLRNPGGGGFAPRVLADPVALEQAAASAPGFVRAAIEELRGSDEAEAGDALLLLQQLMAEAGAGGC